MNHKTSFRPSNGFSLLELIGVLAVISILASILAPSAIRQIDSAVARHETSQLAAIESGLRNAIVRSRQIPNESEWVAYVANELGWPTEDVLKNPRQTERIYLIDGALKVGPNEGTLPYVQTGSGTDEPQSPRIAILSSLNPAKQIPVTNGVLEAARFEEIWNTAESSVPPGWTGLWEAKNAGEELKIQRIHLGSLFHRVILNSYGTPAPFFAIGNSDPHSVSQDGFSSYYIEGTMLKLFDNNEVLETQQIIRTAASFIYEEGTWNGRVFRGLRSNNDDFYLAHELFLRSAEGSASREDFVTALTRYFTSYKDWADSQFPPGETPAFTALQQAEENLEQTSSLLLQATSN